MKEDSPQKIGRKGIILVAVLSLTTFAVMGDLVLIPVAENLYTAYVDTNIVNFILSGPALICAFMSALSGKIIEHMGSRRFLCVGFGIYTLGSVGLIFANGEAVIILFRIAQGVGMGACSVCCIVLIAEHFVDSAVRGKMMGVYNGVMALMGTVIGFVSGIIASGRWQDVFFIYLATIPIFIAVLLFVPSDRKTKNKVSVGKEQALFIPMKWGSVIRASLAFFAYNLIYCVVYYQIAVIMADKGVVDTAFVGLLSSLGTAGSFVACTAFGFYFNRLKELSISIGYGIQTVFLIVLSLSDQPILIALSCLLLGAAYGLGMTYYMTYVTLIVPPVRVPVATSIVSFAMGISMFLAPYLPYALMSLVGLKTVLSTLPVLAGVLAVGCALSIASKGRKRGCLERGQGQATVSLQSVSR